MTDNITVRTLEVRKDNWSETRLVTETLAGEPSEHEVLFRVERLALTSNNISYASSGDSLGYWGFFPAGDGWGRIPAMGWGAVIASAHPDVQVGERVWGFFPFSTHLKILAGNAAGAGFRDISAHRAEYAPLYAQFDRAPASPFYQQSREDQDSLLRGLFMTSWLVEDFVEVNDSFGARSCLITSASSKTSIALGHCVKQRGRLTSIGITSPGNVAFCESLGCYDQVLSYGDVSSLDAEQPVVMVDMAGSAAVIGGLHHHYADNMMHSCRIGATHYDKMGSVKGLPGARPQFFFAPTHVSARSEELGHAEFMRRMWIAYEGFRSFCDGWLRVERSYGEDAVAGVYQAVLAGEVSPERGQIISLWPQGLD